MRRHRTRRERYVLRLAGMCALAAAACGGGEGTPVATGALGDVPLDGLPEVVLVGARDPETRRFNNEPAPVYELLDATGRECELRQIGEIEAGLAVTVLEAQLGCRPALVHVRPIGMDIGPQGWVLGDHVYVPAPLPER